MLKNNNKIYETYVNLLDKFTDFVSAEHENVRKISEEQRIYTDTETRIFKEVARFVSDLMSSEKQDERSVNLVRLQLQEVLAEWSQQRQEHELFARSSSQAWENQRSQMNQQINRSIVDLLALVKEEVTL